MKKFRIGLIIVAFILILAELIITDYDNFWSSKNLGNFLVIAGMILTIISLIVAIKTDKK